MPQGLQCWDGAGNLTLDITDRITRVLGVITPARNGSLVNAGLLTGTPFAAQLSSSSMPEQELIVYLDFQFSGDTFTWKDYDNLFNSVDYPAPINIVYGVY